MGLSLGRDAMKFVLSTLVVCVSVSLAAPATIANPPRSAFDESPQQETGIGDDDAPSASLDLGAIATKSQTELDAPGRSVVGRVGPAREHRESVWIDRVVRRVGRVIAACVRGNWR